MTLFNNRSNDITDFPFQDYYSANDTEMEEISSSHNLRVYNTWMLPQMIAYFGSFTPYKNDKGLIDPRAVMSKNIGNDPWKFGLWKVVMKLKRSSLVKTQSQPGFCNYSALVPLIMSGLKKHQDIPYNSWDKEYLHLAMEESLLEAATAEVPEDIDTETLINIRDLGLLIKSGTKAGTKHNPTSAWKLTGIRHTVLGNLPTLAVTMLTQIWVAHPSLRSKYMILDPRDWDNMPDPLIDINIIGDKMFHESNKKAPKKSSVSNEIPWL